MTDYGSSKKSKYITYIDASNLCGLGTSKYLPYGGFKWLTQKNNW